MAPRSCMRGWAGVLALVVACSSPVAIRDGDAGRIDAGSDAGAADVDASDIAIGADAAAVDLPCESSPTTRACEDGLCTIPSGCFVMGVAAGKLSAAASSNREVQVTLTRAFVIGETEVTRAQWLKLGLPDPAIDWRVTGSSQADVPPPGYELCTDPQCPITWVSFDDAASYANLRSEAEGLEPCYLLSECKNRVGANLRCASVRVDASSPYECEGYRLPTEAEWEYAARAGTRTDYYYGDMDPTLDGSSFECDLDANLDRIGWYCGNSGAPSGQPEPAGHAHPVAQKEPNDFGLYDVAGNAYEWTNDVYLPTGYGDGPLENPVSGVIELNDLTPATHPNYGELDWQGRGHPRIRRGGSFDLWSQAAASGWRLGGTSNAVQHTGFRIARTIDSGSVAP